MGQVMMSEGALNRVKVFAHVDEGRLKVGNAANRLAKRHGSNVSRETLRKWMQDDGKRIRLKVSDPARGLVGKFVDICEMPDGRIQVRAKGVALPYNIFRPHQQRAPHAAITKNKHLNAVTVHIKQEQGKAALSPKVKPVSAKNAYKKTGRRPPGRMYKMEAYSERRRAERATEPAKTSKS